MQETVSLVFDGFQIEIKINTRLRKENCVLISHIVMLLVVADIQTVVSFFQQLGVIVKIIFLKGKTILKHVVAFVEDGSAAGKNWSFLPSLFQAIIFFSFISSLL